MNASFHGLLSVIVGLAALATGGWTSAYAATWSEALGGDGDDSVVAVATDAEGGVYALWEDAECGSEPPGDDPEDDPADLSVRRYERIEGGWDTTSLWRWDEEEDDGYTEQPLALVVTEDVSHLHGYVAAHWDSGGAADWVVAFLDEAPDDVWHVRFKDQQGNASTFVDMDEQRVPNECPGVVVLGPANDGDGCLVVSYKSDGTARWTKELDYPDRTETPVAISCNTVGGVFVTATSIWSGETESAITTWRLDASTGNTVWCKAFEDDAYDFTATDIEALSLNYDVFVLGQQTDEDEEANADVVCLSYRQSDGFLQDAVVYGSPISDEEPVGLKLSGTSPPLPVCVDLTTEDSEGNDVTQVVCYIYGSGEWHDPYYARTLYVEEPAGMVVDAQGNCYVAASLTDAASAVRYTPDGIVGPVWNYDAEEATAADVAAFYRTDDNEDSLCVIGGRQSSESDGCQALVVICDVATPGHWELLPNEMPVEQSGKDVKAGGWLAYDAFQSRIYAAKGNKSADFYAYNPPNDSWARIADWPLGAESRCPSKGSAACSNGEGTIFATKGNNSVGFWKYDAGKDSWYQLADVPTGTSNKKVRGGTDMVYVSKNDTGYVYLLKGYQSEFWRYNCTTKVWVAMDEVPGGSHYKWDNGSWLVHDDIGGMLYAHKAKYHEMYAYSVDDDSWYTTLLDGMPIQGTNGHKKSKEGGCAVWLDNAAFALKGGNTQEFWLYSPVTGGWFSELDTIGRESHTGKARKVKAGADMTVCDGSIYTLKGNNTRDLWSYTLPSGGVDELLRLGTMAARMRATGTPPTDDGETPVMEGIDAYGPRWRPDGQAIIMVHEDSLGWLQLYEVEYSNGIGTETRITNIHADCEQPSYSPSGGAVCFSILDTASGFYQVATVTLDSNDGRDEAGEDERVSESGLHSVPATALQRPVLQCPATPGRDIGGIDVLTSTDCDHTSPAWSPDNGHIVFVKDSADEHSQLWLIPATGGTEDQLTTDDADHEDPVWLGEGVVAMTHIPDNGYDQIAKVTVSNSEETDLTWSQRDHAHPDANEAGTYASFEALDDDGDAQVARVCSDGGDETFLTTGNRDMEAPDWSGDNQSIFCVRWTGITSAICRVDATNGGYTPVTDSSAIRDNPDAFFDQNGNTSYVVYQREAWDPENLLGFGRKWRHGTGIYRTRCRRPSGGTMAAGLYSLALDRVVPCPARGRMSIRWTVPAEADASLKVFNTAGQLVRTLAQRRAKPGSYTTVWNGTDHKGRRLAAGVYFYTLETGDKRLSRKVVLAE